MSLTLIILAAGKGSRIGGGKPLAEVGPNGQSLCEYSVYDACNAGFYHVIFVVAPEQDTAEYSSRLVGYRNKLKIEFVVQDLTTPVTNDICNNTSASRTKTVGYRSCGARM